MIESKTVHLDFLQHKIRELRTVQRKIIIAYGSFDLYTPAHISFFERAKMSGHMLAVAVYSDAYMRDNLETSAIMTQEERQYIIASHLDVNYVIASFADDPCKIIRATCPDILAYMPDVDISPKEREEARVCKAKIMIVTPEFNIQTKDIVKRVITETEKFF